MAHAIIEFQCIGDDAYQTVLRAPHGIAGAGRAYPWVYPDANAFKKLADEQDDHVALKAGDELLASLQSNPSIRSYVSSLVTCQKATDIYFEAQPGAEAADDLPWEVLRAAGSFLSLKSWPIARTQTCEQGSYPKIDYDFFTPVKIMAILSAPSSRGSVSAHDEWRELFSTLSRLQSDLQEQWNLDGDALEVLVLVCEESLRNEIDTAKKTDTLSWINVRGISNKEQIIREKSDFCPHVLHIFGHGGTQGKDPIVRVGSRRDWELEKDGSVVFSPGELVDEKDILWLITLNCCSGAANLGGASSFVKMLVRTGVPAAIGMREPINGEHAQAICRIFYDRVLSNLGQLRIGEPQELDMATALIDVRESLHKNCNSLKQRLLIDPQNCNHWPDHCKHWTLPVLYRRTGGFRVVRRKQRTLGGVQLVASKATLQQRRALFVAMNDTGSLTDVIAKLDADLIEIERKLQAGDE